MKKVCIIFLLSIIISLTAVGLKIPAENKKGWGMVEMNTVNTEYLRIHIRADSNDEEAQKVKYEVRNALINYLTPIVAECHTREEAVEKMQQNTLGIEAVADNVLQKAGFSYQSKAQLKVESFPTRSYGALTLPAGEYLALIIQLGAGAGDNWWCVIYPPLCFVGNVNDGKNFVYKSKILEIIRSFQER